MLCRLEQSQQGEVGMEKKILLTPKNTIMNRNELIAAMAEKAGLTKADAGKALTAYMDAVKESLAKDESVALVGFGTFDVVSRPARQGRNPRTGDAITIAAKKSAKFKASKNLF